MQIKASLESKALQIKPSDEYLAKHTKKISLLFDLSKKRWKIRQSIAQNNSCNYNLFKKLCKDRSVNVRRKTASNDRCPVDILQKLSNDSDCYVRYNVAYNPNCPIEIIEKFLNDSNCFVRSFAVWKRTEKI